MSASSEALYEITIALAEVCQLDFDLNKGRLFRESKSFYNGGITPDAIRERYSAGSWWYSGGHWMAADGKPPTVHAIRQTWQLSAPPPPRDRRQEALGAMRSVAQRRSEP